MTEARAVSNAEPSRLATLYAHSHFLCPNLQSE